MTFCRAAIAALFAAAASAPVWGEEPRYASIVVGADGEVLHARMADSPRHPGPLAKLMTLYLAFEALDAGALGLADLLPVSPGAAGQPAPCLGLAPGASVSALDALKALIVEDANDAAVALAERLGGDELRFAMLMTRKAQALGMTGARFRNATGRDHPEQTATARDLAFLAAALWERFPHYYPLFRLGVYDATPETAARHGYLGAVAGADGLLAAASPQSGASLVASVRREGRRLVVVVLGGPTAGERDEHAGRLADAAFIALARREEARLAERPTPAVYAALDARAVILRTAAEGAPRRLRIVLEDDAPPARPAAEPAPPAPPAGADASSPTGGVTTAAAPLAPSLGHGVQVGAYRDAKLAASRLEDVAALVPEMLAASPRRIEEIDIGGAPMWRARFMGFDAAGAKAACAALVARNIPCFVVTPR